MSSQSLSGANNVPDILWMYYGLIEFMEHHPAMYGLDKRREEYHNILCEHYKITREQSLTVTDNLNKYKDACEAHDALLSIAREED